MFSRKNILTIFITILIVFLISNIFAFSDVNYKPKYGITTTSVNFRSNTSLSSSSKVKTLSKNTNLKMVGEISNFYIVQLSNNEIGIISKDYVKIQGTSLSGSKVYESITKYYATVNENSTNLRGGPGTNFKSYRKLNKGTKIQVIGKIDNWYLIITEDNTVGMLRNDLVTKVTTTTSNTNVTGTTVTSNEDVVLNLINEARRQNGLPKLEKDLTLANVAQIKSDDMVKNNYFSHTSPSYGTPFAMMQGLGVNYKTAGENIAGNSTIQKVVDAWLASPDHRKNILSNLYNYAGIGVTKSSTYGFIIVAMFIGK